MKKGLAAALVLLRCYELRLKEQLQEPMVSPLASQRRKQRFQDSPFLVSVPVCIRSCGKRDCTGRTLETVVVSVDEGLDSEEPGANYLWMKKPGFASSSEL